MTRHLLLVAACLLLPGRLAAEPVDYLRDIKPILKERCYACHGALKQKAKLRLDTGAAIRQGGTGGAAVVPGQPAKSPLLERVTAAEESERMPPDGKPLTEKQIALLKAWVEQGARSPEGEKAEEDPLRHWAFRNPERPPVPAVRNAAWVRNPVDAFVAAGHEARGLAPAPEADRATLLRRVTLDLTGLPPTREELHDFLNDSDPDAYDKVVDRLLRSPRYAERWGRHWMDVWRYSDWYGSRHINELRYSQRNIWRWRDWILESLDADKGYDRMILEMLAGDELAPGDRDVQRAGGYLGRNFYVFNRNVWLQDTVEYTANAFLGLTMKCCRCHDHKYDPFTQEDYYRLRAVFEPHRVRTDPLPGKRELLKANVAAGSPPGTNLKDGYDTVFDGDLQAPTYLFERGNEKDPVKDRPLTPAVPAFLGNPLRVEPVPLPAAVYYPELRPELGESALQEATKVVDQARDAVAKAKGDAAVKLAEARLTAARAKLASAEARLAADRARYLGTAPEPQRQSLAETASRAERDAALREAEADLLQAEQAGKKTPELEAKVTKARQAAAEKSTTYTPFGPVYPATSSGRRLALARWVVAPDNPLTARVAVNHIWLRHLGAPLVPTVANFGRNGKPPTHPELLDWLAVEFRDSGWKMKPLHRLIVTSNTYRMASEGPAPATDPENRYLARANVRRMEAEAVRDSLLHLAGTLDPSRGGPDHDPVTDPRVPRRSLYFRHTPDEKPLMLELFDAANPSECFERTESIVPQQALALANGDFSHSQARRIARNLGAATADDAAFLRAAFEHVLARSPTPEESAKCAAFLQTHAALLADKGLSPLPAATAASAVPPAADPRQRARENLVHVLFNYNEFTTIR